MQDGKNIKIRRPKDYMPADNPLVHNDTIDAIRHSTFDRVVLPFVEDSSTKMFLGNIHPDVSPLPLLRIWIVIMNDSVQMNIKWHKHVMKLTKEYDEIAKRITKNYQKKPTG